MERKCYVSARLQVLTVGTLMIEVLREVTPFRLKKRLPTFRKIVMPECFILTMKELLFFERLVTHYQSTWCNILKDLKLHVISGYSEVTGRLVRFIVSIYTISSNRRTFRGFEDLYVFR